MNERLIRNTAKNNFFIHSKYNSRLAPHYYIDCLEDVIYQPNVYSLAHYIGEQLKCQYIIDIGCGNAVKLVKMYPTFEIMGIDFGYNLDYCRHQYPFGIWREHNLDKMTPLTIPDHIVKNSIVICADVIEQLVNPAYLLWNLRTLMDTAPICLLSTPERELVYGYNQKGPPKNLSHVREWTRKEFQHLLNHLKFNIKYRALTLGSTVDRKKTTILCILGNNENQCKNFDSLISYSNIKRRA